MNFSELFKQSNQLCRFSPNGNHVVSRRKRVRTRRIAFFSEGELLVVSPNRSRRENAADNESLYVHRRNQSVRSKSATRKQTEKRFSSLDLVVPGFDVRPLLPIQAGYRASVVARAARLAMQNRRGFVGIDGGDVEPRQSSHSRDCQFQCK